VERAEWLKKVRAQAEALYDHIAPAYWVKFGMYPDATHRQFIEKFLGRLGAQSAILDAACGAGRYDGMLLEAGIVCLALTSPATCWPGRGSTSRRIASRGCATRRWACRRSIFWRSLTG